MTERPRGIEVMLAAPVAKRTLERGRAILTMTMDGLHGRSGKKKARASDRFERGRQRPTRGTSGLPHPGAREQPIIARNLPTRSFFRQASVIYSGSNKVVAAADSGILRASRTCLPTGERRTRQAETPAATDKRAQFF
jgi:hypothetical protein